MSVAIFGAGAQGKMAAAILRKEGQAIDFFVDNSKEKQGTQIMGIPVISLDDFCTIDKRYELIIACSPQYQKEIIAQIKENGIENYSLFKKELILKKERIRSYSYPTENEDVILYHVLKHVPGDEIHWIDVGSNDPWLGSVTQFFYEKGGSGINIDIEKELIDISNEVRRRDVNLWNAVGKEEGVIDFYSQGDYGGLSTTNKNNVLVDEFQKKSVVLTTLKNICDKYVDYPIAFLKIDVEGMEKEVLEGMDFEKYRAWILVIESTIPMTDRPNYSSWEDIVINNEYHFVYSHGVNRYYVADEKSELDEKFIGWEELVSNYCVVHPEILYSI